MMQEVLRKERKGSTLISKGETRKYREINREKTSRIMSNHILGVVKNT